jgi:hypothetical protein
MVMYLAVDGIPFGGVGNSGYGQWTGKYGFDTFTHQRSSLDSPGWMDMLMKYRNPPYTVSSQICIVIGKQTDSLAGKQGKTYSCANSPGLAAKAYLRVKCVEGFNLNGLYIQ